MMHTAADVVRMIGAGLTRQCRGYLILVPPGFDRRPDVASQVEAAVRTPGKRQTEVVAVSADSITSDADLVDLLVREWCAINGETRETWLSLEAEVGDVPPQQRLKAFFQGALAGIERRVLIIRRFDKAFKNMSGPLLAVLRDLEHTGRLIAVNTSVLSYTELYRRRAAQDPSFVSDYGQSHAALMLGPLDDAEARKEWADSVDKTMERRLSLAYYSVALELSGRVPSLFSKSAAYVEVMKGRRDLREYDRLLRRELAPGFQRLIRYDDGDDAGVPALAESIARVHWRIGTHSDVGVIAGHRWGDLLLPRAEGKRALPSRALGVCAVDMLGRIPRRMTTEALYERGGYRACVEQLAMAQTERREPLAIAAEMLNVAFADSADSLYFAAEVDWRRVRVLAREGMVACDGTAAAEEFGGWARVAEAMNPSGDDSKGMLRKDFVRIGLRILAVRADTNAITSAYSAIPLVEDSIRTYVVRIHDVPPKGTAFADLGDAEISEWWSRGEFMRPNEQASLSGANLVVLAAVLSSRSGARLFEDAADTMRVGEQLDQHRNRLGHRVDTPDKSVGAALADCAERILDSIAEQGRVDLSVGMLANWVSAPGAFLPGR